MVIISFGGNQSAAATGSERSRVMANRRADITVHDNVLPTGTRQGIARCGGLAAKRLAIKNMGVSCAAWRKRCCSRPCGVGGFAPTSPPEGGLYECLSPSDPALSARPRHPGIQQ